MRKVYLLVAVLMLFAVFLAGCDLIRQVSSSISLPVMPPWTGVKVLVVTMFEIGEPTGDFPGEAQLWIEGMDLTRVIDVPGSYSPLYCDDGLDVCLVVTGMGTANATATITAVGFSNLVDLERTYILVAGIAGVDPADGTLGTAAWAEWVVDGDLAHEIDARELPPDREFPYFHLGCKEPWCDGWTAGTEVFHLNPRLTEWAYRLSKDVELADSDEAREYRKNYPQPNARRAPFVTKCDSFASGTYWHGKILSDWANWWTKQFTGGKGNYCMTNMEDSGTLTALTRLADAYRIDPSRIMVLRTASNFDQPYPGQAAIDSVRAKSGGFMPAIQNAYRAGSAVVQHIVGNWSWWEYGPPPLD